MSSCNKISELLSAYIDGEITEKEKELVENHLLTCTSCKQKLDIMKKTSNILKVTPPMPVPETLLKDFEEYRKNSEQTEKKVVPLYKNYRVYASIAAIFVFAFVLKSGLWQDDKFVPDSQSQPLQNEQSIDAPIATPDAGTFSKTRAISEAPSTTDANTPAVAEAGILPEDGAIAAYDESQDASPMARTMVPPAADDTTENTKASSRAIVYVAEEHLDRAASLLSEGKYFYSQIEQKLNDNRIPFESNILSLDESIPHKVTVLVKE